MNRVTNILLLLAGLGTVSIAVAASIDDQDWSGRCESPQSCFVQMRGEGPRLLAGWHPQEQRIRVGALLPSGVGSGQPVTIWLDDGVSIYLNTGTCTSQFCEAMVRPEAAVETVEALKNARGGVITYPEGGKLRVGEISLLGFARAYDALKPKR